MPSIEDNIAAIDDTGAVSPETDDGSVLTLTVSEHKALYMNMVGIENDYKINDSAREHHGRVPDAGRGGLDHRRGRRPRRGDGAGDATIMPGADATLTSASL